jgi:hypothetical protein
MRRLGFAMLSVILFFPAVAFSQTNVSPDWWTYPAPTTKLYAQGVDIPFKCSVTIPKTHPVSTGLGMIVQRNIAGYPSIGSLFTYTVTSSTYQSTDANGTPNASGTDWTYTYEGTVNIATSTFTGVPVGSSLRLQYFVDSTSPVWNRYPFGSLPFNY